MTIRFGLGFPWNGTLSALGDADPLLLAGAGMANLLSLCAKGTVWYLMLCRVGPVRPGTAQSATMVAAAVNSITAVGSGEAVRAQMVHDRDGISYAGALTSLVATRVAEALGLVVFLAAALVWVRSSAEAWVLALGVVVIGTLGVLAPRNGLGWSK